MIFPPAVGGAAAAYKIEKSLRFRASGSASLSRTPSIAGDRKKLAMRFRVKRGALGTLQVIASAGTASIDRFYFDTSNRLCLDVLGTSRLVTTPVFRDPGAWYVDVGFELDVANGTAASRAKILIDGTEVSTYSTDTRSLITNTDTNWNNTVLHYIGRDNAGNYFDGYLAEPVLADGSTSINYSYAGPNGVRDPIRPSATYGTNGFYLPFSNGTSLSTLTADASGNGNNWTATNVSLTAGATYDWMEDTPSNNFAVLNQLGSAATGTTSEANLRYTRAFAYIQSTFPVSSGSWYWEVTLNALGSAGLEVGVLGQLLTGPNTIGGSTVGYGYDPKLGRRWVASVSTAGFTTSTVNDIIGFAFNATAGTLEVLKNNVSLFTITGITAGEYYPTVNGAGVTGTDTVTFNAGQRPFAYTPPTGFQALCTKNLPLPVIQNPRQHFDVTTYTGTGASRSITGLSFSPDLVWMKSRGRAAGHALFDRVRGAQLMLESNQTGAETTQTTGLTAFNSDGWTMGALDQINGTTATNSFVGWAWKANGAPVTNTAGTITSQVSANTQAGFSIVTYTGTGANATVGHGLGVTPKMVIVKRRNGAGTENWQVRHADIAVANSIQLNLTNAAAAAATVWNSTAPTSTVFSIGTSNDVNANTGTYAAYVFAEVPGFSRIGSYTGNGSADGPFVCCGFRPKWVMIKRADAAGSWLIADSQRTPANSQNLTLQSESANAEFTSGAGNIWDNLSNGFKISSSSAQNPELNANGGTYIFIAFAESPFNTSRAR